MSFRKSACTFGLSAVAVLATCLSSQAQLQTSNQQYVASRAIFESSFAETSRNLVRQQPDIAVNGVLASINDQGDFTLWGRNQEVAGLDIRSAGGLLRPAPAVDGQAPDAGPFETLILNNENRITIASPTSPVILDGAVRMPFGYNGRSLDDLNAVWGQGVQEFPLPISIFGSLEYSPFNANAEGSAINFEEVIIESIIEAGSATGTPPDSPAARVDPNDATASFPGVGSFEVVHPTLGSFVCTGTVIDDTHVLTAAHCFDQDSNGVLDAGIEAGSKFNLNDGGSPSATRGIAAVAIHPDYTGFSTGVNDDFAVVTLDSSVPVGTTKYALRTSGMSAGEVVEMVGYGISGFGDVGGNEVLPSLSVKRSGKNEADVFGADDEGLGPDEVFYYDFDGPTGTGVMGGASLGNDVEGVVRGGDSGGPSFVEVDGEKLIAGINTFEFFLAGSSPGKGQFGSIGGGMMINDPQFAWISSIATGAVDADAVVPEPTSLLMLIMAVAGLSLGRRSRR